MLSAPYRRVALLFTALVAVLFPQVLTAATDTVNIVAIVPTAAEGGSHGSGNGVFQITRSDSSSALNVKFIISGTALPRDTNGTYGNYWHYDLVDGNDATGATPAGTYSTQAAPVTSSGGGYTQLLLTVTMAVGETTKLIEVKARADGRKQGAETVTLNTYQTGTYIVGTYANATVTIADSDITATYSVGDGIIKESQGALDRQGYFRLDFSVPYFNRYSIVENPTADTPGITPIGGNRNFAAVNTDYQFNYMYRHQPDGGQADCTMDYMTVTPTAGATYQIDSTYNTATASISYSGFPAITFPYPVNNAKIQRIQVTSPGQNYTVAPTVTVTGTTAAGAAFSLNGTANILNGQVVSVDITDPGNTSFSTVPTVSFTTAGGGLGASAQVVMSKGVGQQLTGYGVINGSIYSIRFTALSSTSVPYTVPPTLTFTSVYGTSQTLSYTLSAGELNTLTTTGQLVLAASLGSNFSVPPTITLSGGDGSGYVAVCSIRGSLIGFRPRTVGVGYTSASIIADGTSGSSVSAPAVGGTPTVTLNGLIQNQYRSVEDRRTATASWRTTYVTSDVTNLPKDLTSYYGSTRIANINKKGYSLVRCFGLTNNLVVGDVITFGTSATRYVIAEINPWFIVLNVGLLADVADDTTVYNAIPSAMVQNRQAVPIPCVSGIAIEEVVVLNNVVQYDAVEFAVEPLDDASSEGAERVVSRVYDSADYQIQSPTHQTVFIQDDDSISDIQLVGNATAGGVVGVAQVTLTKALPVDVSIPYAVSGTAVASTPTQSNDYAALSGYVTIPAGQTVGTIQVVSTTSGAGKTVVLTLLPNNDVILAGSGSSLSYPSTTIVISPSQGAAAVVAQSNASEPATNGVFRFSITPDPSTAHADVNIPFSLGGSALYGQRFSFAAIGAASATYPDNSTGQVTSGGAALYSFDPSTGRGSITLPYSAAKGGFATVDLTVTVKDDQVYEGTQSITATIIDGAGYSIDSKNGQAIMNLADDEPVVSITSAGDANKPDIGSTFIVSYPGTPAGTALNRSITVPFTVGGTAVPRSGATAAGDYIAITPATVTIPANSLSTTIQVTPVANPSVTSDVTLTVTLTPDATTAPKYAVSATGVATMIIRQQRTVSITKQRDLGEAGQQSGQFLIKFADGLPSMAGPLTVNYSISSRSSAVVGTDYSLPTGYSVAGSQGSVTIPSGQSSVTLDVPALDDAVVDPGKFLAVDLVASAGNYILSSSATTATVVANDDEPIPSITPSASGVSPITFTITMPSQAPAGGWTVPLVMSGSATYGTDYALVNASATATTGVFNVSIPAGSVVQTVTVTQMNTSVANSSKTVTATLVAGALASTVPTATVTLPATGSSLSIAATDGAQPATNGHLIVTRVGTGALSVPFLVSSSSTAVAGRDYVLQDVNGNPLTSPLAFQAGTTTVDIVVKVLGNLADTAAKTVSITLQPDLSLTPAYVLSTASATCNLAAQAQLISFQSVSNAGQPSSNGSFTVVRTGPTTAALDVPFLIDTSAQDAAVSGRDYVLSSASPIHFAIGQATAQVQVQVVGNINITTATTVTMTLQSDTNTTPQYGLGSPSTAVCTIAPRPTVSITATDAVQPSTHGSITLSRVGQTITALPVHITIDPTTTTAVAGRDYVLMDGSSQVVFSNLSIGGTMYQKADVTIAAGQSSKVLTVFVLGNSADPNVEKLAFKIHLDSAITTGVVDSYLVGTGTVTCLIAPKVPVLSVTGMNGAQPTTDGSFVVTRTGGDSTKAVTFAFEIDKASSAVAGRDYVLLVSGVPVTTKATIPAGQQSVTITVHMLGNVADTSTESVVFNLVADTAASPLYTVTGTSAGGNATCLIAPVPVLSLSASDATQPQKDGAFVVTRIGPTTGALTVPVVFQELSTFGSGEYQLRINGVVVSSLTAITIPAGMSSQSVAIHVLDNVSVTTQRLMRLTLQPDTGALPTYRLTSVPNVTAAINPQVSAGIHLTLAATNGIQPSTSGSFTITRSIDPGYAPRDLSIPFVIDSSSTAIAGKDYTLLVNGLPATSPLSLPASQAAPLVVVVTPLGTSTVPTTVTLRLLADTGVPALYSFTATPVQTSTLYVPVTIGLAVTNAVMPSTDGTITISRTDSAGRAVTQGALTIPVSIDPQGTAVVGADCTLLNAQGAAITTSVTIPDGQSATVLSVHLLPAAAVTTSKSLILKLANDGSGTYSLPAVPQATCQLRPKPKVAVAASTGEILEPKGSSTITISATGTVGADLRVQVSLSGTATKTTNYLTDLPTTVTLTAAAPSQSYTITAVDDKQAMGRLTVVVTAASDASYDLATPSVTVGISDAASTLPTTVPSGAPEGSPLQGSSSGGGCGLGSGLAFVGLVAWGGWHRRSKRRAA